MLLGATAQVPLAVLHPHQAQPNDSQEAFAEYAASHDWVLVHLAQYLGSLLITIGLVSVAVTLAQRPGITGQLGRIAAVTAVVSTAVFAVQMAVDGVALKAAVEHWATAPPARRVAAYDIADSIRSLEKGLSALFHLNNGITLSALGLAMATRQGSRVLGWFGFPAGLGFLSTAVITAHTGFSPQAGAFALVPTLLLAAFLIAAAWRMWRPAAAPHRIESEEE
jgi:hypothetical protein